MTFKEIQSLFDQQKSWEGRYRLLIQFSRHVTRPSPELLASMEKISGCEVGLWFSAHIQVQQCVTIGFSEARIMNGILWVLSQYLNDLSQEELASFSMLQLLNTLKINSYLSQSRLNGLHQIEQKVRSLSGKF